MSAPPLQPRTSYSMNSGWSSARTPSPPESPVRSPARTPGVPWVASLRSQSARGTDRHGQRKLPGVGGVKSARVVQAVRSAVVPLKEEELEVEKLPRWLFGKPRTPRGRPRSERARRPSPVHASNSGVSAEGSSDSLQGLSKRDRSTAVLEAAHAQRGSAPPRLLNVTATRPSTVSTSRASPPPRLQPMTKQISRLTWPAEMLAAQPKRREEQAVAPELWVGRRTPRRKPRPPSPDPVSVRASVEEEWEPAVGDVVRLRDPKNLSYGSSKDWHTTGVGKIIVGGEHHGYANFRGGEYLLSIGDQKVWAKRAEMTLIYAAPRLSVEEEREREEQRRAAAKKKRQAILSTFGYAGKGRLSPPRRRADLDLELAGAVQ